MPTDTDRLNFIEANPNLELRQRKGRWAMASPFTSYEYETFATAREAIDCAMGERDPAKPQMGPKDFEMVCQLMEEAARNLAGLMDTEAAESLQVRHFLPDELDGSAIMLREHFCLPASGKPSTPAT